MTPKLDRRFDRPIIPSDLESRYGGWRCELVYQYGPEVATYRLEADSGTAYYAKLAEVGGVPALGDEVERMRWASEHLPVPEIVEFGSSAGVDWLITRELEGRPATDPELRSDPEGLVQTLARGLRAFHEAPVEDCPFDFRLEVGIETARRRLAEGAIDPEEHFHEEFAHLSAREAVEQLGTTAPASEDLVVCHGDYCLPNVLIQAGEATGYVDLGELGVADRWWDLSVATWSLIWNLGPGHEERFLSEYGIAPDPDRTSFYRLMYDLVS